PGSGGAAIPAGDGQHVVVPREIVACNLGHPPDERRRPAIPVRKEAAEVVERFGLVQATQVGIRPDPGACVDARRPPREVVALQVLEQIRVDVRLPRDFVEGEAAAQTRAAQVGSAGLAGAHGKTRREARAGAAGCTGSAVASDIPRSTGKLWSE